MSSQEHNQNDEQTGRESINRQAMGKARSFKSISQVAVVLFTLGSTILGLGQACSTGLGGDTSTAAATTESSSISAGSNSSLAITPSMQTVAYNSNLTLSASGGTAPYSFFLASGSGSVNSSTGVFTAPGSDATVSIGLSDATGAKVYAVIMVASSASNLTLAGAYSKVIQTSYSNLANFNGACNQGAPYGDGCNAAIHNFCTQQGYASGFGPNEHSGDVIVVTCLLANTTTYKTVPYVGYSGIIPGCNAGTALSDSCLAAQNRYCKNLGMASGFGPIYHDGTNGTVECVASAAAVYMEVGIGTIQGQVSSCAEANAASPECMSAAFRYCRSQKYQSGYGVVEHNTTNMGIFCTR